MHSVWVDWAFRSRTTGKITIAQAPNVPLTAFVIARIAQASLGPRGTAASVVHWTGVAALTWWGAAEVLTGVNPFRRLLCGAALAVVVA